MERLRAQIMQQDKSGIYRPNTRGSTGANDVSSKSPASPGILSPSTWTLNSRDRSEASAADHYGHPEGYPIGQTFASRKDCMDAGVHRAPVQGIVGTGSEGSYSIVVNDGYEDDIDEGNIIWYTGAGGQENRFGGSESQQTDQSFDHPSNRALSRNAISGRPVRVIRGSKSSKWGPSKGYRYDGLYDVLSAEYAKGKSGYLICRFKLQRRPGQTSLNDLPRT